MDANKIRGLDRSKLEDRERSVISSEEALRDVEPIDWKVAVNSETTPYTYKEFTEYQYEDREHPDNDEYEYPARYQMVAYAMRQEYPGDKSHEMQA